MQKAIMSWSSGKDSAYSLYLAQESGKYDLKGILTTINQKFSRVAMHSTRLEILKAQARALSLPLLKVYIPYPCTNEIYEKKMKTACLKIKKQNIKNIIFGDIYLEDVRQYRIANLKKVGMKGVFPIWKRKPSKQLAKEIINAGIKAKVVCIDNTKLSKDFLGRDFDLNLLKDLPRGIDHCAEKGEFHTCCYYAPNFKSEINVRLGKTRTDGRFSFIDLMLV